MKRAAKKTLITLLGFIFVFIGVIGILLPFLNGVLFIILGLIILSFEFPQIEKRVNHYLKRYPKVEKIYLSIRKFLSGLLGRAN